MCIFDSEKDFCGLSFSKYWLIVVSSSKKISDGLLRSFMLIDDVFEVPGFPRTQFLDVLFWVSNVFSGFFFVERELIFFKSK